jgi:hypothetical protein
MAEQSVKRWGPFSGRQLTVIFVSLIAGVVLLPVAAFGVAKAKPFFITDSTTGARVAGGKLSVDTGLAPTGSVNVSGSVTATATPPAQLWNNTEYFLHNGDTAVTAPAGKAIVITEMYITRYGGPASGVLLLAGGRQLGYWNFQDANTHDVPFPNGVVVKDGNPAVFYIEGNPGSNYLISYYGYTIPAATCAPAGTCGY